LFSGKERDEETGLLYFGARYQDSKYGIWYSVDPLAEKYPGVSSYVYCLDNPVKYVDPDGNQVNPAVGRMIAIHDQRFKDRYSRSIVINPDIKAKCIFPIYNIQAAWNSSQYSDNSIVTTSTNFAINLTRSMGREIVGEGNYNNALRHVTWQALTTKEFGSNVAKNLGDSHEANPNVDLSQRHFSNLNDADQTIDLLNNQIGRSIGEKNKNMTNKNLELSVLEEFHENGFYTAKDNGKNGVDVVRTKLTQSEFNAARDKLLKLGNDGHPTK